MMTTYGRKKGGLFSGFPVFQDEKDKSEASKKRSSKCHHINIHCTY